ncbi:MAG: FG-GAP-like repeat-containing protein, partial [Candidatus Aminicenantes bacterium]|nr:FG-GAP-like repeat-containing protein [Candidatus Aminicenantes bacterium]
MTKQHFFTVSVFLVFSLALSGVLCGQRVIDLDKVWGDMRVLGKAADDRSGNAVAYGDINGDGFMDIIIGAPGAYPGDPPRSYAGETYVIFGCSSPPSTIDLSTQSADITVCGAAKDESGYAVSSGDINADGYDDIIIGAHNADPGDPVRSNAGETYVILGDSFSSPPYTIDLSTTPADITVLGAAADDWSGYSAASGDINGDGYDDLIIGAPWADPGTTPRNKAGETYVIFGSSSPDSEIDLSTESSNITVCGAADYNYSGHAVASGDVNGDGYADVIIGAYCASPGGRAEAGETYVIFGSSPSSPVTIDLSTTPADITVCGANTLDWSGLAVASGDVNGDGYDDVIIGAAYATPGGRNGAGETYVIFGFSTPWPAKYTIDLSVLPADITVCGDDAGDESGYVVASGDVNGDGYDDIIIGALAADPGGRSKAGETYVIFGFSPSSPVAIDLSVSSANITVCGDASDDLSGWAVASGDVNNDGFDDIIIGAIWADPGGRDRAGETYLIAGGGAFITAHGLGGKSWIKEFSLLARDWGSFKAFGTVNSQGEVHLSVGDMDADSL